MYLRWRDLGNAGGAETEWTTTELRNSLRSIEWDLEDLEDTINILFQKAFTILHRTIFFIAFFPRTTNNISSISLTYKHLSLRRTSANLKSIKKNWIADDISSMPHAMRSNRWKRRWAWTEIETKISPQINRYSIIIIKRSPPPSSPVPPHSTTTATIWSQTIASTTTLHPVTRTRHPVLRLVKCRVFVTAATYEFYSCFNFFLDAQTSIVGTMARHSGTKYSKLENSLDSPGHYGTSAHLDSPSHRFLGESVSVQQRMLQGQDEQLDVISDSIGTLKTVSRQINIELDEQAV